MMPVTHHDAADLSAMDELVNNSDSGNAQSTHKSPGDYAVRSRSTSSDGFSHYTGPIECPIKVLNGSEAAESPGIRPMTIHAQSTGFDLPEFSKLFASELTNDEVEQGFKWMNGPNPKYLGFVPGRRDNRKYLNVLPVVGAQPESSIGCYLPVSMTQRWVVLVFVLMLALFGTGVALYLRNSSIGSTMP